VIEMLSRKFGDVRFVLKNNKTSVYCDKCKKKCKDLHIQSKAYTLYGCPKCRRVYYVSDFDFVLFAMSVIGEKSRAK